MTFNLKRTQCGFYTQTESGLRVKFVAILKDVPAPLLVTVNGHLENYYLDGTYGYELNGRKMNLVTSEFYDQL